MIQTPPLDRVMHLARAVRGHNHNRRLGGLNGPQFRDGHLKIRKREVHDAIKRRCLYHWVDYPSFADEVAILAARVPEASAALSREVVAFVQRLRDEDLFKKPGVAETSDWAKCLLALDVIALSPEVIGDTLGAILKYQDDIQRIQGSEAKKLLEAARAGLAA